jgi:hypothetical protein
MTRKEETVLLFKRHRWAAEELAYDQKMQELNTLCSTHPRGLFEYLVECYGGSLKELNAAMTAIVVMQKERRKTLRKVR